MGYAAFQDLEVELIKQREKLTRTVSETSDLDSDIVTVANL